MQKGWKNYNHALIPTTAPHEIVEKPKKGFWKTGSGGVALFARWTEDFDCNEQTSWWYVIKDTPFDITALKAKRRYEINKGLKNFDVRIINANEYTEELYDVTVEAYRQYPKKYRPIIEHDAFIKGVESWRNYKVFGAFYKESNRLCGYAWIAIHDSYVDFACMKVDPEYERYGINAAIVFRIVDLFNQRLNKEFYICDGARSSVHETNFQNYLEKYFGFRKAYCKLKMKYRFPVGVIVRVLYPWRKKIKNKGKFFSKVSSVLFYEEIARENE